MTTRPRPLLRLPSAPTFSEFEESFRDVAFSTAVLHATRTLRAVDWGTQSAQEVAAVTGWLKDLWSLLHRSHTAQDGLLKAEFRALRTWKDVARHTADHLRGLAFASWGHRGPVYEETVPLLRPLVRLQQLGFLTTQGQPAACVTDAVDNHSRRLEHRQRGFIEGIMRRKYLQRFVRYLDTKRASVGYDIVTTDGLRFTSGHEFPPNRERRVSASGTPESVWYLDTRPLQTFEPHHKHRRLQLAAADAQQQLALIETLNPALAKKMAPQFTAYAFVFGLKACRRPVDVLRVVTAFFKACVPARDAARPDHVLTLYGDLKWLRARAKAAAAAFTGTVHKGPRDKTRARLDRERRRFEQAYEASVRSRAQRNDTAVKLPVQW